MWVGANMPMTKCALRSVSLSESRPAPINRLGTRTEPDRSCPAYMALLREHGRSSVLADGSADLRMGGAQTNASTGMPTNSAAYAVAHQTL